MAIVGIFSPFNDKTETFFCDYRLPILRFLRSNVKWLVTSPPEKRHGQESVADCGLQKGQYYGSERSKSLKIAVLSTLYESTAIKKIPSVLPLSSLV